MEKEGRIHHLLTGLRARAMRSPEHNGRRNLRRLRQIVSEREPSVLGVFTNVQGHGCIGQDQSFCKEQMIRPAIRWMFGGVDVNTAVIDVKQGERGSATAPDAIGSGGMGPCIAAAVLNHTPYEYRISEG